MTPKTKKCTVCGRIKQLHLFDTDRSRKVGVRSECKLCKKKKHHDTKEHPRYLAGRLYRNMKSRSKKRGFCSPEFTIDEIERIILNEQCAVTGRRFQLKNITKYRMNPFAASPDRVDTSKGYTKKNVRWVMTWVNLSRGVYDIRFFKRLLKGVRW